MVLPTAVPVAARRVIPFTKYLLRHNDPLPKWDYKNPYPKHDSKDKDD